ncbi:hypothetical protein E1264_42860, partial [Actinomadura sp. KC216]
MNARRRASGRRRGRALVLGSRRFPRMTAIVMAVVMPAGLLSAPSAFAEPPNLGRPTVNDRQEPVEGRNLKVRPRKPDPANKPGPPARTALPEPGSAEVEVLAPTVGSAEPGSAPARSSGDRGAKAAGDLPIEILPRGQRERGRSRAEWAGRV